MDYQLITKYLSETATEEEVAEAFRWIDASQGNREAFMEIKKIWALGTKSNEDCEKAWLEILERIKSIDQKKKRMGFVKYAAVFVGLIIGTFVWNYWNAERKMTLVIEDSAVVLNTGENTSEEINVDSEQRFKTADGKVFATQNGDKIVYSPTESIKELVYNEIKVPRGKTFQLVLSDGSLVHLNSDTSIKFPVNFLPVDERKVFLDGEAYFEVAKDTQRPFLVVSNTMDVRVLGTHFNVSSYKDSESYTVLVEGSVSVLDNQKTDRQKPPQRIESGQKASLIDSGFLVEKVNVNDYLEWRQGNLIFNNEPFKEIVHKIERQYNVDINNVYRELDTVRFNGKFENETIIDLLDTFKVSAEFDYEIQENKIIINQPN